MTVQAAVKFKLPSGDLQICFAIGFKRDELLPCDFRVEKTRHAQQCARTTTGIKPLPIGRAQMASLMEWVAGLAVAHRAGNASTFGDGINAVNGSQCHLLHGAAGPVNLHLIDFIRVTQTKVDAHVVG